MHDCKCIFITSLSIIQAYEPTFLLALNYVYNLFICRYNYFFFIYIHTYTPPTWDTYMDTYLHDTYLQVHDAYIVAVFYRSLCLDE